MMKMKMGMAMRLSRGEPPVKLGTSWKTSCLGLPHPMSSCVVARSSLFHPRDTATLRSRWSWRVSETASWGAVFFWACFDSFVVSTTKKPLEPINNQPRECLVVSPTREPNPAKTAGKPTSDIKMLCILSPEVGALDAWVADWGAARSTPKRHGKMGIMGEYS